MADPFPAIDRDQTLFVRLSSAFMNRWDLQLYVLFIALLLPVITTVAGFVYSVHQIRYNGENTHPEATLVQNALWAVADHHLYRSIQSSPYTPSPYGPLFNWGLEHVGRVVGGTFTPTMVAGRTVVYISFLLTAALCALILMYLGVDKVSSLFSSALFLSGTTFQPWVVTVRPDIPALLWEIAGLFLAIHPSDIAAVAAGMCTSAAILTKASCIAGALAIIGAYIWAKQWKRGLLFVVAALAPVVIVYMVLELKGEPALHQLLLMRYSTRDTFGGLVRFISKDVLRGTNPILLALGLASLGAVFAFHKRARIPGLYFLSSWVIGCVTLLQAGGNSNYLLNAWTATALLAGYTVATLKSQWNGMVPHARSLLLAVMVLQYAPVAATTINEALHLESTVSPEAKLAKAFAGQKVLSDNSYIAAQGLNPEFLDSFLAHELEDAGKWSPTPIIQKLDKQGWDAVVKQVSPDGAPAEWRHVSFFSPAILSAIDRNYVPIAICDQMMVSLPKQNKIVQASVELRSALKDKCRSLTPSY